MDDVQSGLHGVEWQTRLEAVASALPLQLRGSAFVVDRLHDSPAFGAKLRLEIKLVCRSAACILVELGEEHEQIAPVEFTHGRDRTREKICQRILRLDRWRLRGGGGRHG